MRVGGDVRLTRHGLHRFLSQCIDSQIPELLTLAGTVDTWWPEINAFIQTGITNAGAESYNRLVKQVKRAPADSETETTRPAGYDSTAPADSGPQPRLHADCPVKIEEPQSRKRDRNAPNLPYDDGVWLGDIGAVRSPATARVLVAVLALPLAIEAIQSLLPMLGRGCQSRDVVDNLLGLGIGLALGVLLSVVRAGRTRS